MREVVQEALRIPGGALAAGRLDDELERVELLAALIPRLASPQRNAALAEARRLTDGLEGYARARALTALTPFDKRSQDVEAIVAIAQSSENADERAELFAAIAPHVPEEQKDACIAEAVAAARSVSGAWVVSGTVNMVTGIVRFNPEPACRGNRALAVLTVALTQVGPAREALLNEALESLYSLPSGLQPETIRRITLYFSAEQCRQVLTSYRFLVCDPVAVRFRRLLAAEFEEAEPTPQPTPDLETPVEEPEDQEPEDDSSIEVNIGIHISHLFTLSSTPGVVTFDPPVQFLTPEASAAAEFNALQQWAGQQTPVFRRKVYDEIRGLTDELTWRRAMAAVFERLAVLIKPDAALQEARAIWKQTIPAAVAASLAAALPPNRREPLLREGFAAAIEQQSTARIAAFGALFAMLAEPERSQAGDTLAQAIEELAGDWEFLDFAPYLLPLPSSQQLAAVQSLLRSRGDRRKLLVQIKDALPLLQRLAGHSVFPAIAEALFAIDRWWP